MHARASVHKNPTGVGFGTSWLVNTSVSKEVGAPGFMGTGAPVCETFPDSSLVPLTCLFVCVLYHIFYCIIKY